MVTQVAECPRCGGQMHRSHYEPACYMCGYVDYGSEPERRVLRPAGRSRDPHRQCETPGCTRTLETYHYLRRFCDGCRDVKQSRWNKRRRK